MRAKTIRNNMSKKAIAALMAVMIMSAPVTNVTFASEVPVPWTLDGEYEKGNRVCEIKTLESAISLIR